MGSVKDITRGAMRRLNHNLPSAKGLESAMCSEYVALRRELDAAAASARRLLRRVHSASSAGSAGDGAAVAKSRADVSSDALPCPPWSSDGAQQAQHVTHPVPTPTSVPVPVSVPGDGGMAAMLGAYVAHVAALQKQCPQVEFAHAEVLRYRRKVDRLEAQARARAAAGERRGALQRNVTKLGSAQADYDERLCALMHQMRAACDRYGAVTQAAQHLFWQASKRTVVPALLAPGGGGGGGGGGSGSSGGSRSVASGSIASSSSSFDARSLQSLRSMSFDAVLMSSGLPANGAPTSFGTLRHAIGSDASFDSAVSIGSAVSAASSFSSSGSSNRLSADNACHRADQRSTHAVSDFDAEPVPQVPTEALDTAADVRAVQDHSLQRLFRACGIIFFFLIFSLELLGKMIRARYRMLWAK